ncbi:nicotinate (nicotinamide) nucleotide adenylyltransferase [Psychroflexus planctonicus]|uniref:Probable nicotinate-nucleotide adenylyltransferase n=1 Tax=Psychroflexus planctonicus TaxID=1526575 RepID=A0ABQ1SEP0_9FLAO|nr:nicotinate (nicotinamide) nucleotide adenylyltransferase [Psychroflexus planctonicus]GGE34484.1 putative nicotinate-nucleotide adenylyltransferase [Psychroflexus planctonicus]
MKKNIGLYFGSFNPIHIGHVIIANYLAEFTDLDEVWLVISPQSPFKKRATLLENHHRFELVYRAVEGFDKLKASNIEFDLPTPNYTAKTLCVLAEKYPDYHFSIIMGEDNLRSFHKWKNYEYILAHHDIYVCPRLGETKINETFLKHPHIHFTKTPIMEISASLIRNAIKEGKNIETMLPTPVWKYIDEMNFYR